MSTMIWGVGSPVTVDTSIFTYRDSDHSDFYHPRYGYSYWGRNQSAWSTQNPYFDLWPSSRGMSGDPTAPLYLLGGNQEIFSGTSGSFEPTSVIDGGTYRPYYIHGLVVDGSSNPLAAADLDLFLTATDTRIISGISDQNGIYSLPSIYTGQNHYIVANYGPNTYVGASVNTLQPVSSPW